MKCQKCGLAEASVHVVQINDDGRKSLWLCPACAGRLKGDFAGVDWEGPDPGGSDPFPGHGPDGEEQDLEAILGHFFAPEIGGGQGSGDLVCPACGYRLSRLHEETRLGCATCYTTFRRRLRPVIQRFHRHLSHLGRMPAGVAASFSPSNALTRVRIELEHAIAAEDYEEAARLRDRIRELESLPAPDPQEDV